MSDPTPGYINTAGRYSSYDEIANKVCRSGAKKRIKLDYQKRHLARFNAEWAQKIADFLTNILIDAGYSIGFMINYAGSCTMTLYDVLARQFIKLLLYQKRKKKMLKLYLDIC